MGGSTSALSKKAAHMSAQAEKEILEPLELALRFCRSPHRRKQEPLATSRINARKGFQNGDDVMRISRPKTAMVPVLAALMVSASAIVAGAQDIIVTPEQDTVIHEYVKKKPLASVSVPGIELNIGSSVPDTVELYSFEEVPDVRYRYVVIDDRTVLVDPATRRIIKVYD
jgi:hypothetical protein